MSIKSGEKIHLSKKLPRLIVTKETGVNGDYYSISLVDNNERSE